MGREEVEIREYILSSNKGLRNNNATRIKERVKRKRHLRLFIYRGRILEGRGKMNIQVTWR